MLFLETVIPVRYKGGNTYVEKYIGMIPGEICDAFVTEERSGYTMEFLRNPEVGSRDNPQINFSNSASMLNHFEEVF